MKYKSLQYETTETIINSKIDADLITSVHLRGQSCMG